jgi:uncharacterized protein (DUF2141 family)
MYFLSRFLLVFNVCLLLGCAQVGEISGGEIDAAAPKIVREKSTADSLINFNKNAITLTFDEFFELKNPDESIIILPRHTQLKSAIKQKELIVSWDDSLKENTTYVIYINNALKDINEGNDSLYKLVFSTGSYIDSLTHSVEVKDAWSQQPVSNCTVALYSANDSITPTYFSRTDMTGTATFAYLKSGKYKLLGFKDDNSDLTIQASEPLAFIEDSLMITSDTANNKTQLRLFNQEPKKQINYTFQGPERMTIAANFNLDTFQLQINNTLIDSSRIVKHNSDSCSLFLQNILGNDVQIFINSSTFQDTNTVRVLDKEKVAHLKLKPLGDLSQLVVGQIISLEVNALITSIDTSKIFIKNENQEPVPFIAQLEKNQLFLKLNNQGSIKGTIGFEQNAITNFGNQIQDSIQFNFEVKTADAFGKVLIDGSKLEGNILVYLYQKGKLIDKRPLLSDGKCTFDKLIPGEYSLCFVLDENNNGKWDTGDLSIKSQPEKNNWYPGIVKVRRNWDLELELSQDFKDE